ncbi:alpha/beta hydrolase [candidate division KSB1 bacterium]|nr:prolyl oligopeptidase family serine peptidase [candidate division KSB1 bacterium]RQW00360.1 MAG: alpha/beta hydrolase [candidate division KSB1 bacterium]
MNRIMIVFFLVTMMGLVLYAHDTVLASDNGEEIVFTDGLLLPIPRIPETRQFDLIEKQFVLDTWKTPQAGETVTFADEFSTWQPVSVDEHGWFSSESRESYLFCTVSSDQDKIMLLEQNGNDCVYVNGALRAGNRYGFKDDYEAWEPYFGFSILPVKLKQGSNEFVFYNTRTGRVKAKLFEPKSTALINSLDRTMPDVLVGEQVDTWGAVVVINATERPMTSLKISAHIENNEPVVTDVPIIQPLTVRKVGVRFKAMPPQETGTVTVILDLSDGDKSLHTTNVDLSVKTSLEAHKRTFVSAIDGSVQYYAINPAQDPDMEKQKALVLSVHGAAVEAINQASSYSGKSWAHIVAPTNRRPYGFNWEDWGRMDALEVLNIAQKTLNIDPSRIYLTGHSMGGHGTWHLGGTFPDKFAAIGPSAGWLSFWSYRVRERQDDVTPMSNMLMRATSPSRTLEIAENYKQHGIYIIHGADDDNVRVDQARTMVEHLQTFHNDFIYHEEPGQGHWWDISDEPGTDCVDWAPLFDFFARHARPGKERIRQIEFIAGHPGISAKNNWLTIEAQTEQLNLSQVNIRLDPGQRRFVGTTENVARLSFDLSVLPGSEPVTVNLDSSKLENIDWPQHSNKLWLAKSNDQWQVVPEPALSQKGPHRYGTFKEVFYNHFIFVYGTHGNKQENRWALDKARYDAEHFWYQGNGSIDVIADVDFDPAQEPDRNVILYGNADTNSAWKRLLGDSPVTVKAGQIVFGDKTIKGENLACLLIRPRPGSDIASVGVVAGTGIVGMRMTDRRPYLSPGYAYPDLFVFTPEMLDGRGDRGAIVAGFFGLDWRLESGEVVWNVDKY